VKPVALDGRAKRCNLRCFREAVRVQNCADWRCTQNSGRFNYWTLLYLYVHFAVDSGLAKSRHQRCMYICMYELLYFVHTYRHTYMPARQSYGGVTNASGGVGVAELGAADAAAQLHQRSQRWHSDPVEDLN
jgi:hypothetical protein